MNQLILGDNLEILKKLDSESVDLVYLDPPFFSNRNYEVIWGDEGKVRSFKDRWSGCHLVSICKSFCTILKYGKVCKSTH